VVSRVHHICLLHVTLLNLAVLVHSDHQCHLYYAWVYKGTAICLNYFQLSSILWIIYVKWNLKRQCYLNMKCEAKNCHIGNPKNTMPLLLYRSTKMFAPTLLGMDNTLAILWVDFKIYVISLWHVVLSQIQWHAECISGTNNKPACHCVRIII
jgi:hypothetical protein